MALKADGSWDWSGVGDNVSLVFDVANTGDHSAMLFLYITDDRSYAARAANIAARLGDYGKTIGQRIVATDDIASWHDLAESLGDVSLHNVAEPVPTYALTSQPSTSS